MQANDTPEKLLLTPSEASRALSISERSLWAIKTAGEIPYVQIGRSVRYSTKDLKEWIDLRKQGGE